MAAAPIRQLFGEQGNLARNRAPFALEVVGNGAAQTRVGDKVRAVRLDRQIAAGELVSALRAGLDA